MSNIKVVNGPALLVFFVVAIVLVAMVYNSNVGKLDIQNLLVLLIIDAILIFVPALVTLLLVGLGYLIFEALGKASINNPPSKLKFLFRNKLTDLTFYFFYLLFLYIGLSIFGFVLLLQFGSANPKLQWQIPFIAVGYILLFRIFRKLGKKTLADVFEETFLVAFVLAFAYSFTFNNGFPQITLPLLEQQFATVIAATFDMVFLEILWKKRNEVVK